MEILLTTGKFSGNPSRQKWKQCSELEHERASLLDPILVFGQNIAKSSDGGDLLTAADVCKCADTIKAPNLFNVELLNKKDELTELHKNLFERQLL